MKSGPLSWLLIPIVVLFSMVPGEDEEEGYGPEDDGERAEITIDTCGRLAGRRVVVVTSMLHSKHNFTDYYEGTFSVEMELPGGQREDGEPARKILLKWSVDDRGEGVPRPLAPIVKASGDSLRFSDEDGKVMSVFRYGKGRLRMTPAFRAKVIADLETDTLHSRWTALGEILERSGWPDRHILQVLRLHTLRDSIRQGHVDEMIASLHAMARRAADDTLSRYCRRLADSLRAAKEALRPLKLVSARRIGFLRNDPVYPPLDSPTVFWRDSLLAVIREDSAVPPTMRTYDPSTGKWGQPEHAEFPETAMSRIFVKCQGSTRWDDIQIAPTCWRTKLGPTDSVDCEGIDCNPLIALDDSIDGGSIGNFSDLAKAGGSCAAGRGSFEFGDSGSVYIRPNQERADYRMKWSVFPRPLLRGTREYDRELRREYPVSVSPYQDWVAYAMASKDGKGKELWVARLKYSGR